MPNNRHVINNNVLIIIIIKLIIINHILQEYSKGNYLVHVV